MAVRQRKPCDGKTKRGARCTNKRRGQTRFCLDHLPIERRCVETTSKGKQCKQAKLSNIDLCGRHRRKEKRGILTVLGKKVASLVQSKEVEYIKTEPLEPKDYKRYIKSSAWRTKSNAAKKRAGYRCQFCNRHQREVTLHAHHRAYERLGREYQNDLTVFCEDCHNILEKHSRHKPSKVKR